jgi:hypothetical protein
LFRGIYFWIDYHLPVNNLLILPSEEDKKESGEFQMNVDTLQLKMESLGSRIEEIIGYSKEKEETE